MAMLSAAGIALFVVESYIPMPVPFLKVGLANIASVVALMLLGWGGVLAVVVLRVVVGSLFVGSFMGPAFVLAMSAGVISAGAMALTAAFTRSFFSPLGISLVGSVVHVMTQLLIVRFIYVHDPVVFHILPLLLLTALVGGVVVGLISLRLLKALQHLRL